MRSPAFWTRNDRTLEELSKRFASYRGVDRPSIITWLDQFDTDKDAEVGVKILRSVDYYDAAKVMEASRELNRRIGEYLGDRERVFCAPGPPGSSGHALMRDFRIANKCDAAKFDPMFVQSISLTKLPRDREMAIVLIDDIVATGNQAIENVSRIREVAPPRAELVFAPLVGDILAIERVEKELDTKVISSRYLVDSDRCLHEASKTFDEEEKEIVLKYCKRAGAMPMGYGESQLLLVFHSRCPNNTISMLWATSGNWRGLFIRHY